MGRASPQFPKRLHRPAGTGLILLGIIPFRIKEDNLTAGELEDVIVRLAAGQMAQGEFFEWVAAHVRALGAPGNQ